MNQKDYVLEWGWWHKYGRQSCSD